MQRAAAAAWHQRAVARVVTLFNRNGAHGKRHVEVGDRQNSQRSFIERQTERFTDFFGYCLGRFVTLQANTAAEKIFRIDAPGDQIGIGHCRLGAAFAVACRSRRRAGALRSDLQPAGGIDPRDTAATVADFDDIDHRQHHGMTGNITADVVAARDFRVKIPDQTRLRRRAAHVERNNMPAAERLAEMCRRDHARHGPGLHHRHRHSLRRLRRHHAAVGLHDAKSAAEPGNA